MTYHVQILLLVRQPLFDRAALLLTQTSWVLPPLSVGKMTLRLYGALNYSHGLSKGPSFGTGRGRGTHCRQRVPAPVLRKKSIQRSMKCKRHIDKWTDRPPKHCETRVVWKRYLEATPCSSVKRKGVAVDVYNAKRIIPAFNNYPINSESPLHSKLGFCDNSRWPFTSDNCFVRSLDPFLFFLLMNPHGTTIVDGTKLLIKNVSKLPVYDCLGAQLR